MLESFAAWILNTYIGDYFGNVNTDQLRMSLHSGEIELERLPLKRDLLKHFGLPLEANTGYIGKISIKFPRWHLFTSEPLVITVEELYLLVKPITNFTYNEEEENRAQQEFKISQLDTLESRWKALHDDLTEQSSYYSSSYSSWLNYGSSFFSNILLNVHLKISSVHIRYEDGTTIPGCPFATGIVIRSLTVCSTDEHWEPKYVTRDNLSDRNLLFKMIELESFSVYFDTDTRLFDHDPLSRRSPPSTTTAGELILHKSNAGRRANDEPRSDRQQFQTLADVMRANLSQNCTRAGESTEHGYIIAPVNGKCYLKRNCAEMSLKSCKQPRTVIDVQLEQVPIMLTAVQYKHLIDWSIAFQTSKTLWRYRKWRPMILRETHDRRNRRARQRSQRRRRRQRRRRTTSTANSADGDGGEEELQKEEEVVVDFNEDDDEDEDDEDEDEDDEIGEREHCRAGFEPRTWWHFAVNANLEEYRQRRQRFNWHFILRRARDIVAYHRAYLHYLINPEMFSKEMRMLKDRVECELSLDEICSIREIVFAESDRILKEYYRSQQQQQQQQQRNPSDSQHVSDDSQQRQEPPPPPTQAQQSSSWYLPYIVSNLYHNYTSAAASQPQEESTTNSAAADSADNQAATIRSAHRRTLSSSSSTSSASGSTLTDDIFLLRDAVFCQFNFQIFNSSFQLIAFNNSDHSTVAAAAAAAPQSSAQKSGAQTKSGNLLVEFEFTQMKIGVDITNPNAYACVCHMNQAYRRRQQQQPQQPQQQPPQQSLPQKFLTQNELNMLQFNANFECRNLNLTLLRTDHAIISDDDARRLATAQLTGCALMFVFSQNFVSIDGKLDSLEIEDLVTLPAANKHRRMLSIGQKRSDAATISEAATASTEDNPDRPILSITGASEPEKAFSFSLSRQFAENQLRLNIEMASFCYVHSAALVYELGRCVECFSDVLEAYFSRSFKERVKAATTEMLRGIVNKQSNANNSSSSADLSAKDLSENLSTSSFVSDASFDNRLTAGKARNSRKPKSQQQQPIKQQQKQQKPLSPFVDNFKLNIFIRSPVIIFPISPSSYEVAVFHLGHMSFNNHNHSTDVCVTGHHQYRVNVQNQSSSSSSSKKKNSSGITSAHHHFSSSSSSSRASHSYNAEIRDLSVYSLDCGKNIDAYNDQQQLLVDCSNSSTSPAVAVIMPMAMIYDCDTFGVPILQKTVIEIVLEKKVLLASSSSLLVDSGLFANYSSSPQTSQHQQRRPLSSRLSTSPQPPPTPPLPPSPPPLASSQSQQQQQPINGKTSSQDESVLIDGLNIISSVNSIDPLRPPKKFSIRSHLYPDAAAAAAPASSSSSSLAADHSGISGGSGGLLRDSRATTSAKPKPELVLSVEISSIDVRFSYNDLLVFMHIANTLMHDKNTAVITSSSSSSSVPAPPDQHRSSSSQIQQSKQSPPPLSSTLDPADETNRRVVVDRDGIEIDMDELTELFRRDFRRKSRRSEQDRASTANRLRRSKSSEYLDRANNSADRTTDDNEIDGDLAAYNSSIRLSEIDPSEFKLRLDKLQDLGFDYADSLRALALTGGDVIEAAFMLTNDTTTTTTTATKASSNLITKTNTKTKKFDKECEHLNNQLDATSDPGGADHGAHSDDNHSQCTFLSERSNSLQHLAASSFGSSSDRTNRSGATINTAGNHRTNRNSGNGLLSSLSVLEIRILNGSIRVIDDCNQLDIPLLELGVREFRLIQHHTSPVIEAYAQTNFYCDYFNSHLSGWEPVIEHCQISFSWKRQQKRCHLKSMLTSAGNSLMIGGGGGVRNPQPPRQKLALKIEIKKLFNVNISRTLLDLVDKVRTTWMQDISRFTAIASVQSFRHRQPFIPFALKNETGSDLQLLLPSNGAAAINRSIWFATGKAADLITPCDLRQTIRVNASDVACFDMIDQQASNHRRHHQHQHQHQQPQQQHRWSRSSASAHSSLQQKITIKVDGWSATFPVSIEREGTFIRHLVSERYYNQSAILVCEISLQPSAIKLITVRSSLLVANRTTKNVELNFANTAMSDVRTSYIIAPSGLFPVPLKLLYARMQLRPCDLGLGACRTPINWSHVRRYGEQHCSLQICTPITHTSQASYSDSSPYVVTVLVERNSIGALIESHKTISTVTPTSASSSASLSSSCSPLSSAGNNSTNNHSRVSLTSSSPIMDLTTSAQHQAASNFPAESYSIYGQTPLTTVPSHTITLLPPLRLANRLPYELRFSIHNCASSGTIKSGDDFSIHYISPLESFVVEFSMENFPKSKPIAITPGATKDYSTFVDMYDSAGRLLVLHALVTVISGNQQPCNAMTITIYSPYWIVNRSGLPLIFAQEGVYTESAGQSAEHERARSISPLLYSYADFEAPKYCIMRLGRMTDGVESRWCNFFLLEKGTFYRRLRVTESLNSAAAAAGIRISSSAAAANHFDPVTMSPGKAGQHYLPPATEKIYEFGIDIRNGRDRYSHTKIVTIAPRYQIENLTSYKLEFAQRCMVAENVAAAGHAANTFSSSPGNVGNYHYQPQQQLHHPNHNNDFYPCTPVRSLSLSAGSSASPYYGYNHHRAAADENHQTPSAAAMMSTATSVISALPKSNMPFHWPAADMPKLLCVRIASFVGCLWSGSIAIGTEPSVSFHLNVRDDSSRSYFIRVEILLQNATYFIVFTDANSLPPPIRVENFSQVPIEFYQAGTGCNVLQRTTVRPNSCVPYALDEPTLASHLTVCAPGGASSTYDLNSFAPGDNLNYDNFYYIAFEETFLSPSAYAIGGYGAGGASFFGDPDDDEQLMLMMLAGSDFSDFAASGGPNHVITGAGAPNDNHQNNDFMSSIHSQMLVLDVPDDSISDGHDDTKPVILARKERGKRSQLWRIDLQNRIIHEGSSAPVEPGRIQDIGFAQVKFPSFGQQNSSILVLDVADDKSTPINRSDSIPLVIRPLNSARVRTQTWQFTVDGRLRCAAYSRHFVQPLSRDGGKTYFRSGAPACLVWGPAEITGANSGPDPSQKQQQQQPPIVMIPREQAVMRQKMRKGSGVLNVSIMADGPSRVLRIKDQQMSANGRHVRLIQHYSYGSPFSLESYGIEHGGRRSPDQSVTSSSSAESFLVRLLKQTELELNLHIDCMGISVINARNEEIVYLFLRRILLETILNPTECRLHFVAQNFQVDNQLRHCEKEVVLHVGNLSASPDGTPTESNLTVLPASTSNSKPGIPAITFNAHKLFIPNVETNVFKSLQVSINDLVVNIEELLLLKLLEFINYDPVDSEMDEISSSHAGNSTHLMYQANRNVSSSLARSAQYYFAYLLVQLSQVKLSVFTSAQRVSSYLTELKKKAGIKLIRFEDALIQLRPFHKVYSLMTRRFLQDSIQEHYRAELRSQAAKILGTVDFLGNPVGFLNDVADGFVELLDGNISGWIWNVTHGISDSTAKFTSVLSESLGSVTMDSRYQEIRRNIKQQSTIGGQRGHLSAGVLGLAHGMIGGITSLITQTYDGVVTQGGVTGLVSGFGKGIVGTFAKPAVGMLDFASGAAHAVRDSSRKATSNAGNHSGNCAACRVRLPRTLTIDGRVTTYDAIQATWQARFYRTGDFGAREYGEQFVHVFAIADRHFLLLTTERLFFFHSTLMKADLPHQRDDDDDDEDENHHRNHIPGGDNNDQLDFPLRFGVKISNAAIMQLQIMALEQFAAAAHYQMRSRDAQRFVRANGAQQTCLDFSRMSPDAMCDFIELRTTTQSGTNRAKYLAHFSNNNASGGGGKSDDSSSSSILSHSPRTTDRQRPLIATEIEYPRMLNLCYVYCDDAVTTHKLVQLVNEAKHLQEERKFEVASIESSSKL